MISECLELAIIFEFWESIPQQESDFGLLNNKRQWSWSRGPWMDGWMDFGWMSITLGKRGLFILLISTFSPSKVPKTPTAWSLELWKEKMLI
jgi:hypothetical protein